MPPHAPDAPSDHPASGGRTPPIDRLVEALLRSLLSASGREEVEAAIVRGVRDLLATESVALYGRQHADWVCRAATGRSPSMDGHTVDFGDPAGWPSAAASRDGMLSIVLSSLGGEPDLVLRAGPPRGGKHHPAALETLERLAPDLGLAVRRGEQIDDLREQAFLDPLTGCYNRRGFDEHLRVELVRARRYHRDLGLTLVDVDGFKAINDEFGHQGGDHVLRRVSSLLSTSFRTSDVVSRYGGDEFAVIFPETSKEGTVKLAERIREMVEGLFPDERITRAVTVSVGAAGSPTDAEEGDDLVARADRALYQAKSGGRNRVVAATQDDD